LVVRLGLLIRVARRLDVDNVAEVRREVAEQFDQGLRHRERVVERGVPVVERISFADDRTPSGRQATLL
jgi:hypothetical protein